MLIFLYLCNALSRFLCVHDSILQCKENTTLPICINWKKCDFQMIRPKENPSYMCDVFLICCKQTFLSEGDTHIGKGYGDVPRS